MRIAKKIAIPMGWAMAILVWAIACFLFFQLYYPYHFFYQEQNQIFLLSADYLATHFHRPAWLACMLGDFLTQFYYYLYAGPVILTIALLTVGDMARRAMQRAGLGIHVAFAIAMVLMTIEMVCCFKTTYRLSSVIALGGGLTVYWLYSFLFLVKGQRTDGKSRWMCGLAILVLSVLTYWLFGYGCWAFQLLLLLEAFLHIMDRKYHWSILFYCLPILLAWPIAHFAERHFYLNPDVSLTYPGIGQLSRPDMILEKDFAVSDEYHFGNWDKVVKMVEEADVHTDEMLFFYNLVQAQRGELPDHLLQFVPNQLGTFYAIGPETSRLTIINMNELYWALGDMTLTERAAMMTHVFAPDNRNVKMIKRLAECNLVSGDTLAANKYLNILQETWVYRNWADRIKAHDPKAWHYLIEKQESVNHADTIRLSDNLHMVMMELLDSNPDNLVALDYILCSTLLLKDLNNFKRDYDRYCMDTGKPRLKKLYQQALMIYLAGTQAPEEEWSKYIHDPSELQRFKEYSAHRGDPRFNDTYWYYFDTAKAPQV